MFIVARLRPFVCLSLPLMDPRRSSLAFSTLDLIERRHLDVFPKRIETFVTNL